METLVNKKSSHMSESRVQELIDVSKQDLTLFMTSEVVDDRISDYALTHDLVSTSKVAIMVGESKDSVTSEFDDKLDTLRGEVSGICDNLSASIASLNDELKVISGNNSGIAKALLQLQTYLPRLKKTKKANESSNQETIFS